MKSRWTLLLAIVAVPHVAHADWLPTTCNDSYIVTVGASVNGSYGEITYSEDAYSGNFLPSVARDVYSITDALSTELDSQVREMAATANQLNFIYGDPVRRSERHVATQRCRLSDDEPLGAQLRRVRVGYQELAAS